MKKKFNFISIAIFIFFLTMEFLKAEEIQYPKTIQMNPFQLKVENILTLKAKEEILTRTASLQINDINDEKLFRIFLQNGFILNNNKFIQMSLPKTFYLEEKGGVKSVFTIDKNDLALISNKKENCIFFSLLNLTLTKVLLQTECLPDDKGIDLNGIGGAVIFFDENIYLSIGAPENQSEKIRDLAQSKSSIFGKILKISKEDLLNSKEQALKYSIFSYGHRNPQGLVEINKRIFSTEHGPMGGDEINLIQYNKNYGWPLKSYGLRYIFKKGDTGKSFKYNKKIENYKGPIYSFVPSVATSSLSECPKNLKNYYPENICLMFLTLRAKSLFVVLVNKENLSVQNIQKIFIGERMRHFAVDSKIKTFFDNNSFFVSADGKGVSKILKFTFLNFR